MADKTRSVQVGVLSDTHGLLRPAALKALRGSDHIIHAGDIGSPSILDALAALAPVTVVRGNVDRASWTDRIPDTALLEAGSASVFVLHDIAGLRIDPVACGYQAVISGHSHKPGIRWQDGVLFLNPGSAGVRRFNLPVSVARLRLETQGIEAQLINLCQ